MQPPTKSTFQLFTTWPFLCAGDGRRGCRIIPSRSSPKTDISRSVSSRRCDRNRTKEVFCGSGSSHSRKGAAQALPVRSRCSIPGPAAASAHAFLELSLVRRVRHSQDPPAGRLRPVARSPSSARSTGSMNAITRAGPLARAATRRSVASVASRVAAATVASNRWPPGLPA